VKLARKYKESTGLNLKLTSKTIQYCVVNHIIRFPKFHGLQLAMGKCLAKVDAHKEAIVEYDKVLKHKTADKYDRLLALRGKVSRITLQY
jgi:hypothetical protein